MSRAGGGWEDPWRATVGQRTPERRAVRASAGRPLGRLSIPLLWAVRSWRRPPARTPLWMRLTAGLLASFLVGVTAQMTVWSLAWGHGLGRLRPTVPDLQLLPAPVGGHPSGDGPWFLVVGDSISAGITPETLGLQGIVAELRHAAPGVPCSSPTSTTRLGEAPTRMPRRSSISTCEWMPSPPRPAPISSTSPAHGPGRGDEQGPDVPAGGVPR